MRGATRQCLQSASVDGDRQLAEKGCGKPQECRKQCEKAIQAKQTRSMAMHLKSFAKTITKQGTIMGEARSRTFEWWKQCKHIRSPPEEPFKNRKKYKIMMMMIGWTTGWARRETEEEGKCQTREPSSRSELNE